MLFSKWYPSRENHEGPQQQRKLAGCYTRPAHANATSAATREAPAGGKKGFSQREFLGNDILGGCGAFIFSLIFTPTWGNDPI